MISGILWLKIEIDRLDCGMCRWISMMVIVIVMYCPGL